MKRIIFNIVLFVLVMVILLGFIAPTLISSKSDIGVISGFGIMIIAVAFNVYLIHSTLQKIKEVIKK